MNRQGQFGGARRKANENGEESSVQTGYKRQGAKGSGGRERGKFQRPGQPDWVVEEKLMTICGPLIDLPPREEGLKKFSNHCRLWVGNIAPDATEEKLKKLFSPYGEFDELYFDSSKCFALVRFDFKSNAEKAKQELQLKPFHGRILKIRNSNPGTSLKVRNISPWVTNELLEISFDVFGELERGIVITDDRGRSTGEGIVEFCKKPSAQRALRMTSEGCFFLTSNPRPVIVEPLEVLDENDGFGETSINRRNSNYLRERQCGPRFAMRGSFEFEYGLKWKQLYELYDKKKETLEKELIDEKKKLEEEIEFARYQHETERLRDELQHREEFNVRTKQDYQQRHREWGEYMMHSGENQKMMENDIYMKFQQQDQEQRRMPQGGYSGAYDQGGNDFDKGNASPEGGGIRSRLGTRVGGNFELGSDRDQSDTASLNPPAAVLSNPLVKSAVFRVYKELVKELYPEMGPEKQLERARHLSTLPMNDLTFEEKQFVLTNPDVVEAIEQIMFEMQDNPMGSGPLKKQKRGKNKYADEMDFN